MPECLTMIYWKFRAILVLQYWSLFLGDCLICVSGHLGWIQVFSLGIAKSKAPIAEHRHCDRTPVLSMRQ